MNSGRIFLSIVLFICTQVSANNAVTCGDGKTCPEDKPCCSQYGECGTGAYCLGACDVKNSFNVSSCAPLPACKSQQFSFKNDKDVVEQSKYLGDADKYGWTTNGKVLPYNDNLLLTMAKNSYGTVISSTRGIWYGKVSVTLKTSHGNGVVSAFILMSGAKDEIDYEFVGSHTDEAQSNYYWQGQHDYTKADKVTLDNTNENFHTYALDWTEDKITWTIDGQKTRELNKDDTWNETSNTYMFPQTPSIVQISLWPGGSDKNAEGTVEWAGGPIDWSMSEFQTPGYLYATLKDVSIECYDPPENSDKKGSKSYVYKTSNALSDDVQLTDDQYVLSSFDAVGFNMNKGGDDDTGMAEVSYNGGGSDAKRTSYKDVSELSTSITKTKSSSKKTTTSSNTTTKKASESSKKSSGHSSPHTTRSTAKSTQSSSAGGDNATTSTKSDSAAATSDSNQKMVTLSSSTSSGTSSSGSNVWPSLFFVFTIPLFGLVALII